MGIRRSTDGGRRRARVITTLAGGVLAVAGVGAVGVALMAQSPAPPGPPAAASEAAPQPALTTREDADGPGFTQAGHPPDLPYSEPVRLEIPELRVSSTLENLGLTTDGAMETPDDPARAGWFTPSPAPGVVGASVLAGHVTWDQEPAVFFRLGDLRRGDEIEVTRADGTTAVFAVRRLAEFPKTSFPTDAVYGHTERPGLRLITCGGVYNPQTHEYGANLVVWANLSTVRTAAD